jgi:hypothetical protein
MIDPAISSKEKHFYFDEDLLFCKSLIKDLAENKKKPIKIPNQLTHWLLIRGEWS